MRTHHLFLLFYMLRRLFGGHHSRPNEVYLGEMRLPSKRSRYYRARDTRPPKLRDL